MPSGSTFEADLRAVREARGLSLDEIQKETRIPVDVLRRFEEADLAGDPSYNPVYLKAFLQSYARAVGLPRGEVLAAYEAHERGTYAGELHPDSTRKVPKAPPAPDSAASPPPVSGSAPAGEPPPVNAPAKPAPDDVASEEASAPPRGNVPPAVHALATARPEPTPTKEAAAPVVAQTRVNRPAVPTARRSFDKNWGTIIGLFVVLALVLGGVLWFLVFAGDDEPGTEGTETVSVGGAGAEAAIDTSGVGTGAAAGAPQFRLPISVTVTAGGNGLQWFRVTEDGEARTPYWIDSGASQTFEADSSLVLWGEGGANESNLPYDFSDATVSLQGQRFTPQSGTPLRIDRQSGQRLLDSLATAPPPAAPADVDAAIPVEDADAFE